MASPLFDILTLLVLNYYRIWLDNIFRFRSLPLGLWMYAVLPLVGSHVD